MSLKRVFFSCSLLAMGATALVLSGCSLGVENFSKLDSRDEADKEHVGVLVQKELDGDGDGLITPEELGGANTYARSVDEFFRDGDSAEDRELTKEEFGKALLGNRMPPWQVGLIALAVIAIPLPLGVQIAKSLRMPDYGWKISLILVTISAGTAITYFGWPPNLGIDLSGGVIMIYEIDEEATKEQLGNQAEGQGGEIDSDNLAQQIRRRINPGGVSEIVVRPYGPRQVEIIIPNVEEAEIEYYKGVIERTGQLEFFIVASPRDERHRAMINKATADVAQVSNTVSDDKGDTIGRWVPVGIKPADRDNPTTYRGIQLEQGDILRARKPGSQEFVLVDNQAVSNALGRSESTLKSAFDSLGYRDLQVLMKVDPNERRNVKGQHVARAGESSDQLGNPAVSFWMNGPGATLLGALTSQNLPDDDRNFARRMAIIMDNQVLSAPALRGHIRERGEITGDFTREEVQELVNVLNAGKLPAVMRKDPISVNVVSSLLGADTIRSGAIAISLSLVVVLVFMLFYYRFAGIVACLALMVSLLLILALMIMIDATFTLPGIAGLVLTVGMSVDANVLIYERIREELARGAALRMAIRNGFQRATTTIVDANLTTLITGIVLYVIGTDQIRGFAVTLILGILMSMYTAIFCGRVIFDIAERKRWLTKLTMLRIVGDTHLDFIGRRKIAGACSIVLILIGIGALVTRGKDILDIDFLGGTSVQMLLKEPMAISTVRDRVEGGELGDVSVVGVQIEDEEANGEQSQQSKVGESRSFIVNSSITGEETPELGDPVKYTPKGETDALDYIVKSVNEEAETADLEDASGNVVSGVEFKDITRDGVAIVEKRLTERFREEMQFHSVEVLELAAVTEEEASPPESGPSDETTDPSDTDTDESSVDAAEPPAGTDNNAGESNDGDSDSATSDGEDSGGTTSPTDLENTTDPGPSPATSEGESGEGDTGGNNETAEESTEPGAEETPSTDEPLSSEEDAPESDASPDTDDTSGAPSAGPFRLASFQDESTPEDGSDETESEVADDDDASAAGIPEGGDDETTASDDDSSAPTVDNSGDDLEGRSRAKLRFDHPVTAAHVRGLISTAIANKYGQENLVISVSNPGWSGAGNRRFDEWDVEIPLSVSASEQLLGKISEEQAAAPVWLSSNKIGGQVAGNLRQQAVAALLASLVGIIGYIWLRFQRVVFGLAAVVALVHDVLITLGAIALSLWIAKATMGVLLIDEFKISLPIIAALLTIIGYSLNDTIVVFDRIREVRGKNPELTQEMVNTSINQTLGRTLLTSFTTLIVVFLLYLLGGQAIRGFAFALLVGVIVGTYSSIFVASPCLLWMVNASQEKKPEGKPAAATTTEV